MATNILAPRIAIRALTLVEVTIALTVLLSALLLIVGQFQNLRMVQASTQSTASADRILLSLVERLNAVSWSDLGTNVAPWSAPRYEPGTGVASCPPLSEGTAVVDDNIRELGLANESTGLPDLKIYVEYWRAVDYRDGSGAVDTTRPGALESSYDTRPVPSSG